MSDFVSVSDTAKAIIKPSGKTLSPQAIYLMIREGRASAITIAGKIVLTRTEANRIIREQRRKFKTNGNRNQK